MNLKIMERYLRVNLLGPGPRLMKKEFTGPRSHRGWETLAYTMTTVHLWWFWYLSRLCPIVLSSKNKGLFFFGNRIYLWCQVTVLRTNDTSLPVLGSNLWCQVTVLRTNDTSLPVLGSNFWGQVTVLRTNDTSLSVLGSNFSHMSTERYSFSKKPFVILKARGKPTCRMQ